MTIASAIGWLIGIVVMGWLGSRGGVLLALSRAIDHVRAAEVCARLAWQAGLREWHEQWKECLRWAHKHG